MEKLIKAHGDYYEWEHHRHQWFTICRKQSGTILLITDEGDCCLICDRHFNILHQITVSLSGTCPIMMYSV